MRHADDMQKVWYAMALLIGLALMLGLGSKQLVEPFLNVDSETLQQLGQ